MRASRVVSLSALTLALTIGGAGAAAADSVNSTSSATTDLGSTSGYVHSNNHEYSTGSVTTSGNGTEANDVKTGVGRNGEVYYGAETKFANATGVGHTETFNTTGDEQGREGSRDDARRGDHFRGGDEWGGRHTDFHHGDGDTVFTIL
ncbi:MAG TPA: hypothetical protein VGM10_09175 [Actinocrinis sp.]|jgi:hypothetical protein